MLILVRNRQRKIERFFSSFSSHFPAAVHFEMIQLCAALLDTHRFAKSHPVFRISARDTQRFVRTNACDSANILNVPPRVVLIWRRPPVDYRPDGIEPVFMVVCTRQHLKRCTPAMLHGFKLTELRVCLQGLQALPFIL